MSEENNDPFQEADPPPVNPPSSSNNSNIRQFYASDTGKYNFGDHPNPTVYLQGMGTSSGICVSTSFVLGNNYVNFGVSPGFDGYGLGVSGGSIIVRNSGDPGWTVITDIGGSGGGGGGGGGTTPSAPENSVQFNSNSTFTGTSSLQFFEANSTTGGVCTLSVDGNVFSSMGVSDNQSESQGIYQIQPTEFVNGFIFPPYQSSDENQLFVVQVPTHAQIRSNFGIEVLKEGQTFDTVIYGTSIGSSPGIGISFPSDITVLENTGTIFDRRLASDKTISVGLSFHFAGLDLKYYQGVVIRSRMGSAGVSMYPYATSFYTC